jgi:hypothetical protein
LRKSTDFENVYIKPDLTETERFKGKILKEEFRTENNNKIDKDYYLRINNDKVIKTSFIIFYY